MRVYNKNMYISIDLGGTNTRIASSEDLEKISAIEKLPTEQNIAVERKLIIEAMEKLSSGQELKGICIGMPGFVDKKRREFGKIVNIPSFSGLSYQELFGDEVDSSLVTAENDASLAGLGEAVMGAGKGYDVVAYLTLSTGVGGVRISGQRIDPYQNHSEPGHMIIQEEGRFFEPCQQHGCLSSYISGEAFEELYGMGPSECEDDDVWSDYAKKLAFGIINVLAMWGPDVVVLGGSISNKFEQYFKEPLLDQLSKQELFILPPIVRSALGDDSGIYGGFVLLRQTVRAEV